MAVAQPIGQQWVEVAQAYRVGLGTTVVVAGRDAGLLAETFHRAGSPPPVAEADGLVVLSEQPLDGEVSSLADVADALAGLVVLRSAWSDRSQLDGIAAEAHRIARPGGRLLAGDIDIDRLFGSSSIRYPSRVLHLGAPGSGAVMRRRSTRMLLPVAVMRAGFGRVTALEIDEIRGIHDDAEAYWTAVRDEGRPVFADLEPGLVERLLERAAVELRRTAPVGPVVDDEPWFVVTGIRD